MTDPTPHDLKPKRQSLLKKAQERIKELEREVARLKDVLFGGGRHL